MVYLPVFLSNKDWCRKVIYIKLGMDLFEYNFGKSSDYLELE
jgi:hypothetical protein